MRTLVISDLHLGARTGADVLRDDHAIARLSSELARSDRLVLLGDLIELRHGPSAGALAAAAPVLTRIGAALPDDAEIVIVPGNHDHDLIRPWLDARRAPLGLQQRIEPATASPLARRVARLLGHARVSIAYPGLWLREDVYAFHGHYLDLHTTVPTFERLAAGAMVRLVDGIAGRERLTPDNYERVLAPLYAWIHASAQRTPEGELGAGSGSAGRIYEALYGDGHRPMKMRMLQAAIPFGVRGLRIAGLGDLSPDLSADGLLRGSLDAAGEVVARLGIEAAHVIFGHSHRIGPLRNDDGLRWRTRSGAWLHNTGSWVYEPAFTGAAGRQHPYWPGGAIVIDGGRQPRPARLLDRISEPARGRG